MPNKQKRKQLTPPQKRFIKRFIDFAFENMAIEKETPFTRKEAYKRYHQDAFDLILDGTYKQVQF